MFEWFIFNNLKENASKCYLFISPHQPFTVNVRVVITEKGNCKKLLGICIDCNFSSEYYINRICGKASQKIYALSRIVKYVYRDKGAYTIQIFQNFTV